MIKNKTILLTILGYTWAVVPELLGFTNPLDFDLYQCHPEKADIEASRKEFSVPQVTDIWVVTTAAMDVTVQALKDWHRQMLPNIGLMVIPCTGVDDLSSADDCNQMADLIFRAVLQASRRIEAFCRTDPEFHTWNDQIKTAVKLQDTGFLADQMAGSGKALRYKFAQVPEPLTVCAFLRAFETEPALLDELAEDEFCRFQLIFIASRHGAMEKILQHRDLALSLAQDNPVFRDHFSGFDLAGAESAKQPLELREAFIPLMEQCVQFTIHAGEDEPVENIWQAVYHLAAGVKVTVNTDDPGMSRTNLSHEYLKAARMTEKGPSQWDILQLIRNSFRAAFAPHKVKGECLVRAEKQIMKLVTRQQ